jgi:hypothetical protein
MASRAGDHLLQSHSLPDELVTNDPRWNEFVSLFVRDLRTKPLTFSPPRRGRNSNTVLDGVLSAAGRIAEQYVSSATFSDDQKYLSKYDTKHDFVLLIGITKVNDQSWTATVVIPLTI